MYLARPRHEPAGGVLVLHSWWGLNDFFHSLCDRFAKNGFVALAPDLYDGKIATTIHEAKELRAQATASRREPAYKLLIRMISQLEETTGVSEIGVVGSSMRGHWACWLAQRPELPILATVIFYAARNGDYSKSRSAFMAHFAESDEWVSASSVQNLGRSLAKAGKATKFYTYPGTSHWFFEQDRSDAFRPEAAALAWERTAAFLKERFG